MRVVDLHVPHILWVDYEENSGYRKRVVEFKGASLHDGFGGLAVSVVLESALPSLCLPYKIQYQEPTVTVSTVLAVSAVVCPP